MFDTRFVGYGGDKVAWAHEAAMHGYQCRVQAGVFAVHMPEQVVQEHCHALLPGFCHVAKRTPPRGASAACMRPLHVCATICISSFSTT
jgi:hypothetical protein